MDIKFVKLNPTENMTILVESSVSRSQHATISKRLMAYSNINAEQVGFIEPAGDTNALERLQMMGGEFCGNATMSIAAFYAWKHQLDLSQDKVLLFEVSGSHHPVSCQVSKKANGYVVRVDMPLPSQIEQKEIVLDSRMCQISRIAFQGITHYIVPADLLQHQPNAYAKELIATLSESETEDAIGILFYYAHLSQLVPLIYIKSIQSEIWERGCGSGTAAVGAYLAYQRQTSIHEEIIKQPGGFIQVDADCTEENMKRISITGVVEVVARGTAYLEDIV